MDSDEPTPRSVRRAACIVLPDLEDPDVAPVPERVCVIDLGTNSFHAIIVDAYPNGAYKVVDRMKEMVRLGKSGLLAGVLPDDAIERGIRALRRIHILARGWGVQEYLAFATSAIREAKNGGEFIRRVRREVGLRIRAISGAQEAELIYQGVTHAVDITGPTLVVDIGGGSVECIVSTPEAVHYARSLKLGAARMTEQFVSTDPLSAEEQEALRTHYERELASVVEAARAHGVATIVGSSGTAKSLARVAVDRSEGAERPIYHKAIDVAALREALEVIVAADRDERAAMPGIGTKRVDQIGAGALLLQVITEQLSASELRISPHALREGMVEHFIAENYARLRRLAPFADVRRRSVYEAGFRFDWDEAHAQHVAATALLLYDTCASILTGPRRDRELLEYAALLHDVGYHISHSGHHKHSRYLIENADFLGFQADEVAIMANVARYHRKSHPKPKHKPFRRLTPRQQRRVRELASILRIAEGLDRSHFQNVVAIQAELDDQRLAITVDTKGDPQLEVWGALHDAALFEGTFGRKVEAQAGAVNGDLAGMTVPAFDEVD